MTFIQSIVGYIIIIGSIMFGIPSGNILIIIGGVAAGLLLISIARAVDYLQDMSFRSLGIPLIKRQIRRIKSNTKEVNVVSSTLEIVPRDAALYPILKLDNDLYIRARALHKYMTQEYRTYRFNFPNRDPLELTCADNYSPEVNMFTLDEQPYVKIAKLADIGLTIKLIEESLLIENETKP